MMIEKKRHTHTHTHTQTRTHANTPAVVTAPVDGELLLADAAVERHVVGHPERRVHGGRGGAHDSLHRLSLAGRPKSDERDARTQRR